MGEMLLNGRLYGASGIRELTQAQYDALPASKLTDGVLYCIKDTGIVEGDKYAPIIYSLEEREVGVWTDGKPLYEKTIKFTTNATTGWSTYVHGISDIDSLVSCEGYVKVSTTIYSAGAYGVGYLSFAFSTSGASVYFTDTYFASKEAVIVLRYTKTTDVPGSGTWGTDGVPMVHCDGTERIIGTWFGETLYEKTYHYTGTLNSNAWVTLDSSILPSNTSYFSVTDICFMSTELSSSAKLSAYTTTIPFDIAISTGEQLYFENKSNYKIYEFAVTVQYTKTT